jgi:hypothetical protein
MILRAVAALVAVALLGASAHAIVAHIADGYSSPHAIVILTLAAGVAIGALSIGAAWHQRRKVLAVAIGIALLCGEAFGLVSTAERIVGQRDHVQASVTEAAGKITAARERVGAAERELAAVATSDRLLRAEAAKAAADATAQAKASERSCAVNCRAILEQQVATAAHDVKEARREIETRQEAARKALEAARAHLATLAPPGSPSPLADRLGLAAWQLDLLAAALASIAVNGLAAALLVFAGHGRHEHAPAREPPAAARSVRVERGAGDVPMLEASAVPPPRVPVANVREHAARFGVECFAPDPRGSADLETIKATYAAWCGNIGVEALPDAEIGRALADLFSAAGLRVEDRGGRLAVAEIVLKEGARERRELRQNAADLMRVVEHAGKTARSSTPAGQLMPAVS